MQTPQIQNLNYAINKFCATGHLTSLGLTSRICKIKLLQEGSSNSHLEESRRLLIRIRNPGEFKNNDCLGPTPRDTRDASVQPGLKSQLALTLCGIQLRVVISYMNAARTQKG